ncbi:MAG: hypothetical protein BWY21_00953 [Parcubacteria group bacterium ADurb.Bin216]|nr:MAG: hypothetical protein BWY21_00953 [Parcubacteria group bacterium ADurb.Bin216]
MSEKNYIGKGKVVGSFGNIKIGIKPEELVKFANDKGYINIIVQKMKEKDRYGNEYTVFIDDWKPTGQTQGSTQSSGKQTQTAVEEDLPF